MNRMGLNPIKSSEHIVKSYLRYIGTTFYINNKQYREKFEQLLSNIEYFAKGPYLDFTDSFEYGKDINSLIEEGILSKEFFKLYKNNKSLLYRRLYKHQELAIRNIKRERNLVVSTGTGSGKTESFLLPILEYLMRQKESGELNSGVRALIIYPMNALANDQMKRMRKLLKDYPDITFGAYTGETEKEYQGALGKYKELNDNEEPMPNERISRNDMKENPPHILITNYAMLEYLLLRPSDNIFFYGNSANKWKYIVLDEAHTYTGATGIEVSMLLRRLKNILSDNQKIKFILTSATLGEKEDDKKICDFASRLCADSLFDENSVVRAFRYSDFNIENAKRYPVELYEKLFQVLSESNYNEDLINLIKVYDKEFQSFETDNKKVLYEFLCNDYFYYRLRKILKDSPATIKDIANKLDVQENDVVAFVSVARLAEKNNIMLLDARYHMFIRALEGAYVTLGKYNEISIIPKEKTFINGEEYKCYKLSVCQYCGQMYLEALQDETGYLVQKKENEDKGINDFYMIIDDENLLDYDGMTEKELEEIYCLCGKCGRIINDNIINKKMCNCGKEHIVKLFRKIRENGILNKCAACEAINTKGGILRLFYLGQEAVSSVLGSSLYEEIPSEEVKVKKVEHEFDMSFFGEEECDEDLFYTEKSLVNNSINKQLLVFSDSRQEAAYFASYFGFTYNNLLRRRLIIEAVKESGEESNNAIEISTVVKKLAFLFERYKLVSVDECDVEAWKTILYEISSNDRNSLENMALISFEYDGFKCKQLGEFYKGEEVEIVQRVLANSFKRNCMFKYEVEDKMTIKDKEYYLYNGNESTMSLSKEGNSNSYSQKWIPLKGNNVRVDYIKKTTNENDKQKINKFLEDIWKNVLLGNSRFYGGLVNRGNNEYIMDISKFKVKVSDVHKIKWYICSKCGRVTVNNIKDTCPSYRCDGKLSMCNIGQVFVNNHYRKLYQEMDIFPMKIKEHTAQLSAKTAKKYQEMFIKKEINVLSCSTTFEMGVDVGDLETVFMKNMPPTPANYIQRAGRAGRTMDSVAYSLTFCRLSSHDLTYFNAPIKMIRGKIYPPQFKVENEKIVKRHMNAAIIASFWKENSDSFRSVGDFYNEENYNKLLKYIKKLSQNIVEYIKAFMPKKLVNKVDDWIEELSSENSALVKEYNAYKGELEELNNIRNTEVKKISSGKRDGKTITQIDYYINKIKKENILSFLSKKNIIPKYGFPVDTVELVTSFNKKAIKGYSGFSKLRLQRDLMMAISEYAPGSEVIADGNIYKSQFIKTPPKNIRVWDLYDFGICSNELCGHLNIKKHIGEENNENIGVCEICGEIVQKENTFIIPEYGFIISKNFEKATTKKPKKTYKGEIYYIGDKNELKESYLMEYMINRRIVKVKSTSNDELVVINKSKFLVCNECGFTKIEDKEIKENYILDKDKHENPYGSKCDNNKLYKRTIGHKFKTDVAAIIFDDYIDYEKALSILYSLLEGVSEYLGIERKDISGTISRNKLEGGSWETSLVLFDTVPGGAGHVRRIGKANEVELIEIFKAALKVVKQCNCGQDSNGDSACYSCLCNYYNQRQHDIIKRKYAIEFFEEFLGINI